MPAALALHERREIIARREQGESLASIARSVRRSYDAVRRIYHAYVNSGRLSPAYERCKHTAVRHDATLYEVAIALKAAHPGWGAGLIVTELRDQYPQATLPSVRTLQRWFRRAGVQKPRGDQVPKVTVRRGKVPHEVWALDAKEDLQLMDGSYGSWLTITDEGSGAILSATLFPHSALEHHRSAAGETRPPTDNVQVGTPGKAPNG